MRVIEAEAKAILARHGLPTPSPSRLYKEGEPVGAWKMPIAAKAQTLSGKRAEAGLVQLAPGSEAPAIVARIGEQMQKDGQKPLVLVEAQADIDVEYYYAWRIDDLSQRYVLLVSSAGGSDIESRADSVAQYQHSPLAELHPFHLAPTLKSAGIPAAHIGACARFAVSLLSVLIAEDATLLEINPTVITKKGRVMAVDAKMIVDDSAAKRHQDRSSLASVSLQSGELTELEGVAAEAGFTFVELSGSVAVYSAGAGLGMCLLDMLADAGVPAANFSDASGGSSAGTFARMGQVVFRLAERDEIDAIVFFFVLAATSLKSVVDGILHLLDTATPPKPLVIGLIAAGAAERELTLADAQQLISERGIVCVADLTEAVDAVRTIVINKSAETRS